MLQQGTQKERYVYICIDVTEDKQKKRKKEMGEQTRDALGSFQEVKKQRREEQKKGISIFFL